MARGNWGRHRCSGLIGIGRDMNKYQTGSGRVHCEPNQKEVWGGQLARHKSVSAKGYLSRRRERALSGGFSHCSLSRAAPAQQQHRAAPWLARAAASADSYATCQRQQRSDADSSALPGEAYFRARSSIRSGERFRFLGHETVPTVRQGQGRSQRLGKRTAGREVRSMTAVASRATRRYPPS